MVASLAWQRRLRHDSSPLSAFLRLYLLILLVSFLVSPSLYAQTIEEENGALNDDANSIEENTQSLRTKLFHQTGHNQDEEVSDNWLIADSDVSKAGGLLDALFTSFSMILVSEIGDETFIIAALLAMRHPRSIVLSGALSALVIMTILSTGLGRIVPNLISKKHTNNAATVLYTFFGLRLLYIAWRSTSKSSQQKEFEESTTELGPYHRKRDPSNIMHIFDLFCNYGQRERAVSPRDLTSLPKVEEKLEAAPQGKTTWKRVLSRFCTPIFLEAFILTFLAEWGDRSQIATIALATHKNAVGVTVGAIVGHTICTSVAVVGGRLLALKISQRTVAMIGGLLFLGFALTSYFYPPL